MKRLLFLFALAATLCACSKESYNDEFTGSFSYNTTAGSHYLQTIATELLVDNMRALENALEFNSFGSVSNSRTSSYHSNGKNLWEPGAEWTVNAVTSIKGVKISKDAADSTWTLTRDADYGMAGNTYPTAYSITLRMHKGENYHFDWEVSAQGTRTESKGYGCKFWTDGPINYQTANSGYNWSMAFGTIWMEVNCEEEIVDRAFIRYNGSTSDFRYMRGL
jgi:hypothetical protein